MNELIKLINQSAETLEKIADSRGVARAVNIAHMSDQMLAMAEIIGEVSQELEELRKFKEEHSEHDDKCNEVSAES